MKWSLTLFLLVVSAAVGFAQARIGFMNDSTRLVYFSGNPAYLDTPDASVAGKGVWDTTLAALAGSPLLVADLWAGTSATSLSKVATSTSWQSEGSWTPVGVTLPAPTFPAAVMAYFQVQIHDSRDADAMASTAAFHYFGFSSVFTAVPQAASYNPIYQTTSPVYSGWDQGSFQIVDMPLGSFGAIEVILVPEPGTLALAGLGLGALLMARRGWNRRR